MSDSMITYYEYGRAKRMTVEQVASLVYTGWHDLILKLVNDLLEMGWNGELLQVKEKFGTLRFYPATYEQHVSQRVAQAERESAITCLECGAPGELRNTGWLKVLCDTHYEEVKN